MVTRYPVPSGIPNCSTDAVEPGALVSMVPPIAGIPLPVISYSTWSMTVPSAVSRLIRSAVKQSILSSVPLLLLQPAATTGRTRDQASA